MGDRDGARQRDEAQSRFDRRGRAMAIVERIEAATPGARRRLRHSNPATLAPLGEIEVATSGDVRAAVERARKAQPSWAALSFAERGRFLERAARELTARQ